jgi:hypothetical protein
MRATNRCRIVLSNPTAGGAIVGAPATLTIVDDERSRAAGLWDLPFDTGTVAVHLHHLPDRTVLFWEGDRHGHEFEKPGSGIR